jgi:hypothetical protein
MRSRLLVAGLLVGVVSALLSAGPAAAATPPTVTINCDSRLNWVNTSISGGAGYLTPNFPMQVEFRVAYGSYVTASTLSTISTIGSTRTVPATTGADGSISAVGYGHGWQISSDLFYTETVRVTLRTNGGGEIWQAEATCARDLRTVVTLTCDRQAHTVTAQTTGTRYDKPRSSPVRVEYTTEIVNQQTADSPGFGTVGPAGTHPATPDSTGAFADTGFVHPVSDPDPYYHSERVWVVVRDVSGVIVGRGAAACLYIDQGAH